MNTNDEDSLLAVFNNYPKVQVFFRLGKEKMRKKTKNVMLTRYQQGIWKYPDSELKIVVFMFTLTYPLHLLPSS